MNAKYAGSSDEMVALMKNGGGGQYDMVSSSGDADLRILYAGDAHPVNVNLIPSWKDFYPAFQSPPFNTINGVHYGVSLQWGPNVLMYNTKDFPTAPASWSVIYNPKYKGQVTVPDNPIQIADAALYLKTTKPSLGITDPYELTQPQFQAAVSLLAGQRPLIEKYWGLASQEIFDFKNGNAIVGAGWPYQVSTLKAAKFTIGSVIPSEGATGWADTWMLAAKAPHPNCAYMWMQYISTPKVQAEQAVNYGETPDNKLACPYMNKLQAGSCASTTPTRRPATSTRSACGRRRSRPVTTASRTACPTRSGFPRGTRKSSKTRSEVHRTRRVRVSAALWRRPWARATLLLTPPLAWFVLLYLAALVVLLITAFWQINPFTTNIERIWSLTTSPRSSPARPTGASSAGRWGWRRRSRWPTPSSPSRSPTTWPGSRRPGPGRPCSWRSCCRCGRATWPRCTPGC